MYKVHELNQTMSIQFGSAKLIYSSYKGPQFFQIIKLDGSINTQVNRHDSHETH